MRIGKLFGVRIEFWPSVLVIPGIPLYSMVDALATVNDISEWFIPFMWMSMIAIFFVSLLVHEFAHIAVAHCYGKECSLVEIMPMGALAHINISHMRPAESAHIAIAGPLVSLVIGIAIAGLASLSGCEMLGISELWKDGVPNSRVSAVVWMGSYTAILNFSIAVFNLIPAYPMDGGRLFHAFLWAVLDNARRAELVASCVTLLVSGLLLTLSVMTFNPIVFIISVLLIIHAFGTLLRPLSV